METHTTRYAGREYSRWYQPITDRAEYVDCETGATVPYGSELERAIDLVRFAGAVHMTARCIHCGDVPARGYCPAADGEPLRCDTRQDSASPPASPASPPGADSRGQRGTNAVPAGAEEAGATSHRACCDTYGPRVHVCRGGRQWHEASNVPGGYAP